MAPDPPAGAGPIIPEARGHIPMLRLPLATVAGGKAVANWDDDGLTMTVRAAIACLDGIDVITTLAHAPVVRRRTPASRARCATSWTWPVTLAATDGRRPPTPAGASAWRRASSRRISCAGWPTRT